MAPLRTARCRIQMKGRTMRYHGINRELIGGLVATLIALLVVAMLMSTVGLAHAKETTDGEKTYRIGFHLWKPGKIYDEAMQGIRDGLNLSGIKYEEVILESGRNKETARENLQKLDAMGMDLIYSLSSAGTKIAKELNLATPVIATVINHPASLGVGQVGADEGTHLTGTSYYVDAKKQLELYAKLFPQIRKVGMIFDANNPAGALAEEPFMRRVCAELGIDFVSVSVKEKGELTDAADRLVGEKVDVVVIPTNKLVYANLASVVEKTAPAQIPIVSMNKQGVENGALAALFADTYNLGRQTADMATQILTNGADPRDLDFQYIPNPDIIINLASANRIGFVFPPEILSEAAIILQ